MRNLRTTHGRPKSAKVRCLCLAAQHTHFAQGYAIRFTPRVTNNLEEDGPSVAARHLSGAAARPPLKTAHRAVFRALRTHQRWGDFGSHASSGVANRRHDLIHHRPAAAVPLPLEGKACSIACPSAFPFGEGGRRPDGVCLASPHHTHFRMRTQRAIHGRPKSAKVRCLCLAAQHKHIAQGYALRFAPRVTENLGVRGDRSHFRVPPAGFSRTFRPDEKSAKHSTHLHTSARRRRVSASRSASPAEEKPRAAQAPTGEKPRAAQAPQRKSRAQRKPPAGERPRAAQALRRGEAARSASPPAGKSPLQEKAPVAVSGGGLHQLNSFSSSSYFSWVISASCCVPSSFTMYVQRP